MNNGLFQNGEPIATLFEERQLSWVARTHSCNKMAIPLLKTFPSALAFLRYWVCEYYGQNTSAQNLSSQHQFYSSFFYPSSVPGVEMQFFRLGLALFKKSLRTRFHKCTINCSNWNNIGRESFEINIDLYTRIIPPLPSKSRHERWQTASIEPTLFCLLRARRIQLFSNPVF